MAKKLFQTPPKINSVNIEPFIRMANPIFGYEGKKIPEILFDTSTTQKADIIGLLLIYKFFEYTCHKHCFYKPNTKVEGYIEKELNKYELYKLVQSFIKDKRPDYDALRCKEIDKLYISPICLRQNSETDEISKASRGICGFYSDNDAQYIIITCLGELAQNFLSHAKSDTTSIISLTGNINYFEIACVDTGDGIISTLKESFKKSKLKIQENQILSKSFEKGVSSKDLSSGHMGYGLWLIKEIVLISKGEMSIFSEGYYVRFYNGKVRKGRSPYWKGTIVSMRLPLCHVHELKEKIVNLRIENQKIKIRTI